jgi:transglycosylase-like protein with SLT domain
LRAARINVSFTIIANPADRPERRPTAGCGFRALADGNMDISGIFNQPRSQSVNDAIRGAATSTGTSFEYLLAAAQAESSLNPRAASPTSSAKGLYQFIDQTWLATLKRAGPALGYGKYADAITQSAAGHYDVADPAMRRDIMALRFDPTANAAMAGALTRDNAAALAGGLGRKASDGELYIAHVLGSAGAVKLTSLAATHPNTPADAVFPAAAEANRSIFYDRQGRARSVLDVYGVLVGRYDGARTPGTAAATPIGAATAATATAAAAPAVGAPLVIVPDVPVSNPVAPPAAPAPAQPSAPLFRSLFSDRSEPVSQVVQDLWTPPAPTPPANVAPSDGPWSVPANGAREMFQPPSTDAGALFRR